MRLRLRALAPMVLVVTDVYTVIYTGEANGQAESIPWMLSFGDLELAKNHVREEAKTRLADEESAIEGEWEDCEEHSTFVLSYDRETKDTWTIVRTELIDRAPAAEMTTL